MDLLQVKRYWDERARIFSEKDEFRAATPIDFNKTTYKLWFRLQSLSFIRATKVPLRELENKKIMDFGCGIGRWCEYLSYFGARCIGVDISREMLEIAQKRRNNRTEFYDFSVFPFPDYDKQFDYALAFNVLHTMNNLDDIKSSIGLLSGIIKTGGRIAAIIYIPNKNQKTEFIFNSSAEEWEAYFKANDLMLNYTGIAEINPLLSIYHFILRHIARFMIKSSKPNYSESCHNFIVHKNSMLFKFHIFIVMLIFVINYPLAYLLVGRSILSSLVSHKIFVFNKI